VRGRIRKLRSIPVNREPHTRPVTLDPGSESWSLPGEPAGALWTQVTDLNDAGIAVGYSRMYDSGTSLYDAIRICNLGPSGCDITTAVAPGEADELGAGDWLNDGSGLLYTSTDVNRRKRKTSVRRVDLAWDGSRWSRPAGSTPVTLFSGSDPSSSPDDSQIAARGITIVDASSFASTSATNGSFPDWRVPVQ